MPRRFSEEQRGPRTYHSHENVRVDTPDMVTFASAVNLLGVDPFHEPERFLRAPWFFPMYFKNQELINEYVVAGMLPGRIPIGALTTRDYELRFAVPVHCVLKNRGETLDQARTALIRLLYQRTRRTYDTHLVPERLNLDTWCFRSFGESTYGPKLAQYQVPDNWFGVTDVHSEALMFQRPLLRADFRTVRKSLNREFCQMIKWERSARSRTGYFVPYQCVEVDRIAAGARRERYVRVPEWFDGWEVCRGMQVDLPPVLTY